MAKCPYNRKRLTQISQSTNDLVSEETGIIKSRQDILKEEYELMECFKEECGVWHKGRCCYQVVQLNE
jgi:hypothetical protein